MYQYLFPIHNAFIPSPNESVPTAVPTRRTATGVGLMDQTCPHPIYFLLYDCTTFTLILSYLRRF